MLFNKTSAGPRRLIILVHGWGGDQLHTWRRLPMLLLSPIASREFGGHYDVLLYAYPTGFLEGDQSLLITSRRAMRHFATVAAGLGPGIPRYEEIYVIAHSMGALVAQWAFVSAILSEDEQYLHLVSKTRGIVFIAAPNGRLRNIVQQLGQFFGIRQVIDQGPYASFRDDLEKQWVQAEEQKKTHFIRLFRKNTALVTATKDDVVDNESTSDRFTGISLMPVAGDHVSVVKVERESDELFRTVLAPFLRARLPTERGLNVTPLKLVFVTPDVQACGSVRVKNVDRARVSWSVSSRPKGVVLSTYRRDSMEPGEEVDIQVARITENPLALGMDIHWAFDGRKGDERRVSIDFEEIPASPQHVSPPRSDACSDIARAFISYSKTDFPQALASFEKAKNFAAGWEASPLLLEHAGLIYLKGGRPDETLNWWAKLPRNGVIEVRAEDVAFVEKSIDRYLLDTSWLAIDAKRRLFRPPTFRILRAAAKIDLVFAKDRFDLDPTNLDKLREFVRKSGRVQIIHVNGYAADQIAFENNIYLAQQRAAKVAEVLKSLGVEASKIRTSWTELTPTDPNHLGGFIGSVSVLVFE